MGLDCQFNKGEQDILNPKGINLIRAFPGMGIRVWGARTVSSDPSWKYINVRRLFIFIEESIKANTNWAVFEPNDEVLWVRVKRTIDVYEGVVDYLENFTVSDRDMTKYIIGTISNIDQPMTPATKGERSMNLYMNKVSAEMIKKERAQILDAAQEDIRALAKVAKAVLAADQLCVIGGEEKIEEDKELFGEVTNF